MSKPRTRKPQAKRVPGDTVADAEAHAAKVARAIANLPKRPDGSVAPASNKDVRDPSAALNPRQSVLTAFGEIGGVRWLKKLAKRYPKDFVSLLNKAMPTDISITGTVGYVPMPIPVETRDPIEGEFTVIQVPALPSPQPVADEPDPFA